MRHAAGTCPPLDAYVLPATTMRSLESMAMRRATSPPGATAPPVLVRATYPVPPNVVSSSPLCRVGRRAQRKPVTK